MHFISTKEQCYSTYFVLVSYDCFDIAFKIHVVRRHHLMKGAISMDDRYFDFFINQLEHQFPPMIIVNLEGGAKIIYRMKPLLDDYVSSFFIFLDKKLQVMEVSV